MAKSLQIKAVLCSLQANPFDVQSQKISAVSQNRLSLNMPKIPELKPDVTYRIHIKNEEIVSDPCFTGEITVSFESPDLSLDSFINLVNEGD